MRHLIVIMLTTLSLFAGNRAMERRVARVMSLGVCTNYSSTESYLLELAKPDAELTRNALIRIHQDRVKYWNDEKRRKEGLRRLFDYILSKMPNTSTEGIKYSIELQNEIQQGDLNATQIQEAIFALISHRVSDPLPKP